MPRHSAFESDEELGRQSKSERTAAAAPCKFVFTISSPCLVMVNRASVKQPMKDFAVAAGSSADQIAGRTSSSSTNATTTPRKLKIKMHSLIIKMVNNLIQQELISFEAVQILSSAGNIEIRILLPASALNVVLDRCERIGVGSVVGHCYAVPLETSMLPDAGPPRKLAYNWVSSATAAAAAPAAPAAPVDAPDGVSLDSSSQSVEEDDGYFISSEEDNDMDDEEKANTLQAVPFLGADRKKELQRNVAEAREEWLKTASRVRVEQVVEEVAAGAAFTLDYLAFVLCASTIAGVGLATDNSVTVLASMLVSPIMGPVLGFTFGTTINRKSLIATSFRNEAVSLLICIMMGMLISIVAAYVGVPELRDWPSDEMTSRGDVTGLMSGIVVALASGVAVALSTLGKNSSGLTGVAISLSLLPPAVNAGMCWMYQLLLLSGSVERNQGDDSVYWEMGVISFSLTILNIACIWIAGVFMFRLKEVAPVRKKNAFWSQDVKTARQEKDAPLHVDMEKIEHGLEAVIQLREGASDRDVYHNPQSADQQYVNTNLTSMQVGAGRRKTLAANATEDAFFFAGSGVAVGGDGLYDEMELQYAAKRRNATLFDAADKFGGLQGAGAALFDSKLSNPFVEEDSTVGLIRHDMVAEQILVQDAFEAKNAPNG